MKDYYRILGIHPKSSVEEIKEAYRRLAHKHHPDKGGSGFEFKQISEAYLVLSNLWERREYDSLYDGGMNFEVSFQNMEKDNPKAEKVKVTKREISAIFAIVILSYITIHFFF